MSARDSLFSLKKIKKIPRLGKRIGAKNFGDTLSMTDLIHDSMVHGKLIGALWFVVQPVRMHLCPNFGRTPIVTRDFNFAPAVEQVRTNLTVVKLSYF